ncbi:MAG: pyridoxamine 5'-phosphate oxidase [Hyphomicrobiaceae bacterium]|nr:pyridoxamine 5'-phosphate oxidase [Hyphomicrobiaceae bacterium]
MSEKKNSNFEGTPQAPDFSGEREPLDLFKKWLGEAREVEINDPEAMALASVDPEGLPNLRMVLLKEADERGFVFYTNFGSAKGQELLASGKAALNFHWKSLRRQVRLRGAVTRVSDAEADEYYASRARGSRIGAWASKQSQPLESRFALEKRVAKFAARHGVGKVPRPQWWSGFRLVPSEIEFWHDRPFRLHDRLLFTRKSAGDPWDKTALYP